MSTDTDSLRRLAQGWRAVSARSRCGKGGELLDDDPGPHITAVQLEWAAREIDRLRAAPPASVGTARTVRHLAAALDEAVRRWEAMLPNLPSPSVRVERLRTLRHAQTAFSAFACDAAPVLSDAVVRLTEENERLRGGLEAAYDGFDAISDKLGVQRMVRPAVLSVSAADTETRRFQPVDDRLGAPCANCGRNAAFHTDGMCAADTETTA